MAKQVYEQQSAVAVGLAPDALLPEVTVAATGSCGRAEGVPIGALCKLSTGPDVDDQMLWRALELRSGPLGRWLRHELLVAEKLTQRAAARRAERDAKQRGGEERGVTWAPSGDEGKAAAAGGGSDDDDGCDGSDGSGGDGSGSDGGGSGSDGSGSDGSGSGIDVSGSDGGNGADGSGSDGSDSSSDGSGSSSDVDSDTARARRRAVAFESASDSDGDAAAAAAACTPLARAREARAAKLAAVEAASVATKPWQLRGEVGSRDRPADSLLAADLEHDVARRPAAPPSTVTTSAIEALLRRRIADAHWDDVAVPVRPTEALAAAAGQGAAPDGPAEVSQQKPTEGLGDLYAAEYVAGRERLAASAAADSSAGGGSAVATAPPPVTESPEQAEVNAQWRALSRKLDLLANLQLPPKDVARTDDDGGRPDNVAAGLPALAAEDVVPEGISDATLLAPQEVHQPATAAPAGERERTKEERAAARRRKKRRSAGGGGGGGGKARSSVVFGADVMGGGGTGGGRMRGRGDGGGRGGDGGGGPSGAGKPKKARASSSAAFFRSMQETVAADIQRKKDKAEGRGVSKATMGSAATFMR